MGWKGLEGIMKKRPKTNRDSTLTTWKEWRQRDTKGQ